MAHEEKEFSFSAFIKDFVETVSGKLRDKGTVLSTEIRDEILIPDILTGHPAETEQLLKSFVNCIFRFEKEVDLKFTVSIDEVRDGEIVLEFRIQSLGEGLESELLNIYREYKSTGYSVYRGPLTELQICSRLVNRMGGEFRICTDPGRGSTFCFTGRFGYRRADICSCIPVKLKKSRILILGSGIASHNSIYTILRDYSLNIRISDSAEEFIKPGSDKLFDLIIVDYDSFNCKDVTYIKLREVFNTGTALLTVLSDKPEEGGDLCLPDTDDSYIVSPVNRVDLLNTVIEILDSGYAGSEEPMEHNIIFPPGRRALLVEGDELYRKLVAELLETAGIATDMRDRGGDGVKAVAFYEFDILIIGTDLKDFDLHEALKLIRELKESEDLPVIVLADSSDKTADYIRGGADSCIVKPFEPATVYREAVRLLKPEEYSNTDRYSDLIAYELGNGTDNTDVFDFAEGLKHAGGDTDRYLKILKYFSLNNRDFAATLKTADSVEREVLVKKMRAVSWNIGATGLFSLTGEMLEAMEKNSDTEALIEEIEAETELVLKIIKEIRGYREPCIRSFTGISYEETGKEELKNRFTMQLKCYDIKAVETFARLAEELPEGISKSLTEDIANAVDRYDFNRAALLYDVLKKELEKF